MTKRQSIINRLKTIVKQVKSLEVVETDKLSSIKLNSVPLPAAFIYGGNETRVENENAIIGYETWLWDVYIEVWTVFDVDVEDILKDVHTLVYNDYTLGGYAVIADRIGAEIFTVDPEKDIAGILISYRVLYRHVRGTPEV